MELDARRTNTALHLRCRAVGPTSCAGHLVPSLVAVKDPCPVTSFYGPLYMYPVKYVQCAM